MRVFTVENQTVIDKDETVIQLADGIDLNLVSVSDLCCDLRNVSELYQKALFTKSPEDAARYVKMKQRYLDYVYRRDVVGERYEF